MSHTVTAKYVEQIIFFPVTISFALCYCLRKLAVQKTASSDEARDAYPLIPIDSDMCKVLYGVIVLKWHLQS